ncbi:MAG: GMC family oxidoreductase [Solimonas sp.]
MKTIVPTLPQAAEVIVVGGGTCGAVIAARLAERGLDVLVLEAGPDPGAYGDPRWPADLLDATRLPTSHDWGFDSRDTYADRVVPFERAKVIGGCSTHNGAVQTWGHRLDYDGWAALGNPGWSTEALRPLFERASAQLRVRTYAVDELTPWQRAWYEAGPEVGLPQLADLNDFDETVGIAPESVNIVDGGVRWNSAFAYLDPLRGRAHLRIVGDVLVDRVLFEHGRAAGVSVVHGGVTRQIRSPCVVLASGSYGTPAVLLRSGVGPAADLDALRIPRVQHLPGVGAGLHDQPFIMMRWAGSDAMRETMLAAEARGWTPDEQAMAKAASSLEREAFDLHILPYSPTHLFGTRTWHAGVGALCPRSRGRVWLTSRDPAVLPSVDHAFLSDPEGHDVRVLLDGIALLREMAARPKMAALLGRELRPGPEAGATAQALAAFLKQNPNSYWHPVGSCRMGPATDPSAVVDAGGAVHGLDGCHVADCSIMPFVPRATTAMPAVVIAERVAEALLARRPGSS